MFRSLTIRTLTLALSLFALWLLMSGLFKPLLLGLGVLSSLLCAYAVQKLGLFSDSKTFWSEFRMLRFLRYMVWLTVEVGKADWAVTKIILAPELPARQSLIAVPATQQSEFGKALFANSITLTPGTITVETEDEYFIVHALTDEAADLEALADMNGQVCATENHTPTAGNA